MSESKEEINREYKEQRENDIKNTVANDKLREKIDDIIKGSVQQTREIMALFTLTNSDIRIKDFEVVSEPIKCDKCNGDGFTAEHDEGWGAHDEETGHCLGSCPIKAQCEPCQATGYVDLSQPLQEFLKEQKQYKDANEFLKIQVKQLKEQHRIRIEHDKEAQVVLMDEYEKLKEENKELERFKEITEKPTRWVVTELLEIEQQVKAAQREFEIVKALQVKQLQQTQTELQELRVLANHQGLNTHQRWQKMKQLLESK